MDNVRRRRGGWARWTRAAVVLCALLPAAGCDRDSPGEPVASLTAEQFVAVVMELRVAERELPDDARAGARFLERRAAVLERHGVTEESLRAFVDAHADDPDLLAEVWDSINQRLRHVPEPDDGTPPGPDRRTR